MKLKRLEKRLVAVLGGPKCCCAPCGGCQLKGRKKKKRLKGVTSALCERYEIWPFSRRPPSLLKKKFRKIIGEGRTETQPYSAKVGLERDYSACSLSLFLSAGGSVGVNLTCMHSVCVRACVCLQVFERVPETREEEGG